MAEKYNVIGLMSGTSLDGLDLAYVCFILDKEQWHYNILETKSVPYPDHWDKRLAAAINLSNLALTQLDKDYGYWVGKQAKHFIEEHKMKVDLVASHGHTIFHEPHKGLTLQIGDGQAIADTAGVTTISDFRSGDVALGGQGAPLVPIGDKLLFPEYSACLNLGGIVNISFEKDGQRRAFDIGMANMPLNFLARQRGLKYDEDGLLAAAGTLNPRLLRELNLLAYYDEQPPKSLGLEWFLGQMLPLLNSFDIPIEDKLATLVHHESMQIARVIDTVAREGNILVTGGGAYNRFLITQLVHYMKGKARLKIPDNQLVEYKEALIFALMGVLRSRNEINCLKSVTGAREDSSGGEIFNPGPN